jgi:hypothetical protein
MSLTLGIFPDHLKLPIIKPLYKNGDKSQNYCPVSLLTGFSKIMEIVIS